MLFTLPAGFSNVQPIQLQYRLSQPM